MTTFLVTEFSALTRRSACPRRGCRSGSATRCSPAQPGDAPGRRAGRHHCHLLGQAAVTVNLILFALLSTGCFLRAIQNQPAQSKSGCTICFAFPTDNILWASFVPREGAALMAPRCRDGTLLAPGLGAALLGQAFPNLSPNPGKAVL